MSAEKKNYGRTIKGELITDELIEKLVQEAEKGWDVEDLSRKGEAVASPPLGNKAKHPRQQH
jgi:hypothetical protein